MEVRRRICEYFEKLRAMRDKLLGTVLFVLLISCILYLVFFSAKKTNKGEIKMIEIAGNNLLTENDYLAFTRLDNISNYDDLTLPVIKDRLEKHPYIERVDVEYNGLNKAIVILYEKRINAVILSGNDPYFITDNFQVLPLFPNTKFVDLPVISNPVDAENISPLKICRHDDIEMAFKIIESAKLTDINILKRLAEINLRSGGDIVLTFSGVKAPVVFGKGEEAKKMVYLEIIWETLMDEKSDVDDSDYIDLRFASEIYVGNSGKQG